MSNLKALFFALSLIAISPLSGADQVKERTITIASKDILLKRVSKFNRRSENNSNPVIAQARLESFEIFEFFAGREFKESSLSAEIDQFFDNFWKKNSDFKNDLITEKFGGDEERARQSLDDDLTKCKPILLQILRGTIKIAPKNTLIKRVIAINANGNYKINKYSLESINFFNSFADKEFEANCLPEEIDSFTENLWNNQPTSVKQMYAKFTQEQLELEKGRFLEEFAQAKPTLLELLLKDDYPELYTQLAGIPASTPDSTMATQPQEQE